LTSARIVARGLSCGAAATNRTLEQFAEGNKLLKKRSR